MAEAAEFFKRRRRSGGRRFEVAPRNGFSWIELICVLGILSALAALFMPAVQRVRDSARELLCKSRLRAIAIAAHNFEAAYDRLPPGTLGWNRVPVLSDDEHQEFFFGPPFGFRQFQNTSSLCLLLPFLDLADVYDQLPRYATQINSDYTSARTADPSLPEWIGDAPEMSRAMRWRLSAFTCPSDVATPSETSWFIVATQPHLWIGPDGEDRGDWFGPGYSLDNPYIAPTNYLGCAGAHSGGETPDPDRRPYTGVMSCRARIRLSNIKDGTGDTVMYGESIGMIDPIENHRRRVQIGWMFGGLGRGRGDCRWKCPPSDPHFTPLLGDSYQASAGGFGSRHAQSVNFAMCDGGVRAVARQIDWQLVYSLTGASDGGPLGAIDDKRNVSMGLRQLRNEFSVER